MEWFRSRAEARVVIEQWREHYNHWLGIGTMFSMAVLAAMVSISLDMVVRVAAAFWGNALLGQLLGADFTDGITSQALQQGGLGMILTTLLLTTPPMAAMFFQGTVGQFAAYNSMGMFAGGVAASNAMRPGPGGQMVPASSNPYFEAPRGQIPTDELGRKNTAQNTGGFSTRTQPIGDSGSTHGERVELRGSSVATSRPPPPPTV